MKIQPPKGVFDLLPDASEPWKQTHLWQYVEHTFFSTTALYNFEEIRTPIFESTELFSRSVGESSDIVSKEMYTFEDRAGRLLSLRPEGTAPVIRAYLTSGTQERKGATKFSYCGPMFRYERQQAGRYRQHHQLGAEIFGDDSPERDAELIDMLLTFYSRLGLKNLTLTLNSLGDAEARQSYRSALQSYLTQYRSQLSEESQRRFTTNPLRILDSKNKTDREILENAPSILDFLSPSCSSHFDRVQSLLQTPFTLDPHLVRGLDYYTRTVFEVTASELGAQNSIGGGGRYDRLVEEMGGAPTPALGFGTGIERIIQTLLGQQTPLPSRPTPRLLLIPLCDAARDTAFSLLYALRAANIPSEVDLSGKKLKSALKIAAQLAIPYVAILGEDELNRGIVQLKNMSTHTSEEISYDRLPAHPHLQ